MIATQRRPMTVDRMVPDDSEEMLRLASVNGKASWLIEPGTYGLVVRDGARLRAFCILIETAKGHSLRGVWTDRSKAGLRALHLLIEAIEGLMCRQADALGHPVTLSGIVMLENPAMRKMVLARGYWPIGELVAKEFS